MLSLVENIQSNTPGVRIETSPRRVPHLSPDAEPPHIFGKDAAIGNVAAGPRIGRGTANIFPRPAFNVDHEGPTLSTLESDSRADRGDDPIAWTPKNPRLAQLAEQIRQLHHRGLPPPSRCPSGLPALDAALGGGFATAAVHELLAPLAGAAVWSVALRTAARAAGSSKWILYIDTQQDLYPPALAQLGVPLGRLIVVRASHTTDALWVCEQTLRCRAVAAVVLPLRTIDANASRRLQLAAEAAGSLGLLLRSAADGGPTFAASRLRCDPFVGEAGVRRLRITVLKLREGRPREPFVVELPDAADVVPAHSVSTDGTGATRRCVGQ